MIKKDIIEKISEKSGLNKVIVKKVIDDFLIILFDCFENKERVELRNFGVFYFKKLKSKKARNPKTGEEVIIPERIKLIFKPSKKLKIK
ncbi:MAG: integration host factor subunit beta [Candidatus Omnitrophica bacterium]|nr:integration host factor subunit beta [Candidatus Omnitrophota bacterium]